MDGMDPSSKLQAGVVTSIYNLNPDLQEPSTLVTKGVVTIVWPYSAFKGSTAFILAEADFRLRRDRGQVRVELLGPCAKAFAESGVASGDEVTLSLDGVTWADKDARTHIAGTPLPWQLQFRRRLLLQAVEGEAVKTVDVNEQEVSEPDLEPQAPVVPPLPEPIKHLTPPPAPTPEKRVPAKRSADGVVDTSEFASPAFIKRARVSYGSLFEGGLDIFEEDAANQGRAKKRAKTGRFSMSWRYASQSPSPEPEEVDDLEEQTAAEEVQQETSTPSRPNMVDGGCQTDGLEFTPPRHVDVIAEARRDPFQMDETPSKAPPIPAFGPQHQFETRNLGVGFTFGSHPLASPELHDHGHSSVEQASTFPGISFDPSAHGEHDSSSFEQEPPIHPLTGAQDSIHAPAGSYHNPHPQHGTLPAESFYPAPDESQPQDPDLVPYVSPGHHSDFAQPATHLELHHRDLHHEEPHHAVFLDRVEEPQQAPWGYAADSSDTLGPSEGVDQGTAIEIPSSSPPRPDLAHGDDEGGDAEAYPDEEHATRAEGHHSRDGAFRVEEDDAPEEQDGPEGLFVASNYGERHFEDRRGSQTAPATEETSFRGDGSQLSVDEEARDAGGDYDISHYSNLSHVQDDDDAAQLESDYGQEGANGVYDTQDEDDEIDEDAENFDNGYSEEGYDYDTGQDGEEGYDQEEMDEEEEDWERDEVPKRGLVANSQPQVISLLSDSDDDDDDAAPTPQTRTVPPPMQPNRRTLPQYDGSADESPSGSGSDADGDASGESDVSGEPDYDDLPPEDSEDDAGRVEPERHVHFDEQQNTAPETVPARKAGPTQAAPSSEAESPEDTSPADTATATGRRELLEPAELTDPEEPQLVPMPVEIAEVISEQIHEALQPQEQPTRNENDALASDLPLAEPANAGSLHENERVDETEDAATIEASTVVTTTTSVHVSISEEVAHDANPDRVAVASTATTAGTSEGTASSAPHPEIQMNASDQPQVTSESSNIEMSQGDDALAESAEAITRADEALASVDDDASVVENKDQDKGLEQETIASVDMANESTEIASAAPASPPTTQADTVPSPLNRIIEEAEPEADVIMGDADAQLPTPDETQNQEEDYSQDDIDMQLAQETAESTTPKTSEPAGTRLNTLEDGTSGGVLREHNNANSSVAVMSSASEGTPRSQDSSPRASEEPAATTGKNRQGGTGSTTTRLKKGPTRGRGKSDQDDADHSVKLARGAIASRRSTRLSDQHSTPDNVRVTRAVSHNFQRSASPDDATDQSVLLAQAALQSPSRRKEGADAMVSTAIKIQLAQSLRQDVPDCITLKVLRHHPNRTVDVIVIVATEPPEPKRAKGGPRGIMLSFNVTDHSIAPANVTLVNIFRANKSALPLVKPGDAVLLRQFTITAMTGRGFGLRANDASSWAVFDGEADDEVPQIRGPPVELSRGDKAYAMLLKKWHRELEEPVLVKMRKTNEKALGSDGAK